MGLLKNIFGHSPFKSLNQHTQKVHDCVKMIEPMTDALLEKDFDKVENFHNEISRTEHEADILKTELREKIDRIYLLAVEKGELSKFLTYQDSVADAAEDYAVVLNLRRTRIPEELRQELRGFVKQVVKVSEHLLDLANKLSELAESAFAGEEAEKVLKGIDNVGQEEWKTDRLARAFCKHFYSLEENIDPITIFFLDKICNRLGRIANSAEKTAKYLRLIIKNR